MTQPWPKGTSGHIWRIRKVQSDVTARSPVKLPTNYAHISRLRIVIRSFQILGRAPIVLQNQCNTIYINLPVFIRLVLCAFVNTTIVDFIDFYIFVRPFDIHLWYFIRTLLVIIIIAMTHLCTRIRNRSLMYLSISIGSGYRKVGFRMSVLDHFVW